MWQKLIFVLICFVIYLHLYYNLTTFKLTIYLLSHFIFHLIYYIMHSEMYLFIDVLFFLCISSPIYFPKLIYFCILFSHFFMHFCSIMQIRGLSFTCVMSYPVCLAVWPRYPKAMGEILSQTVIYCLFLGLFICHFKF